MRAAISARHAEDSMSEPCTGDESTRPVAVTTAWAERAVRSTVDTVAPISPRLGASRASRFTSRLADESAVNVRSTRTSNPTACARLRATVEVGVVAAEKVEAPEVEVDCERCEGAA
jgi:hypothetical protein